MASSASQAIELLASVDEEFDSLVSILGAITDHGSGFANPYHDDWPCLDHEFERFFHDNDIEHTLCKVGRPQSNGKIERFSRSTRNTTGGSELRTNSFRFTTRSARIWALTGTHW